MDRSESRKDQAWIISNEFATVRLCIDTTGQDARLRITDLATDLTVALDAFMLAGLTTASEADFSRHMDPNPKGSSDG